MKSARTRKPATKTKPQAAKRPAAPARGARGAAGKLEPRAAAAPLAALATLCARDLMSEDLVTAYSDTPIEDVLARFDEYSISALPVVDEVGKPLGIISKADVARIERMRNEKLEGRPGDRGYGERDEEAGADFPGREDYSPELLGRALASDWMHPGVVYVSPEAILAEVCRLMLDERIHHLVVVQGSKVIGMISSLDVVRVVGERC